MRKIVILLIYACLMLTPVSASGTISTFLPMLRYDTDSAIRNSSFEQGNNSWENSLGVIVSASETSIEAYRGHYLAKMVSSIYETRKIIRQTDIIVPYNRPFLHYYVYMLSGPSCIFSSGQYPPFFWGWVFTPENSYQIQFAYVCEDRLSDEWEHQVVDLSELRGETITLEYWMEHGTNGSGTVLLDNIYFSMEDNR